MCLSTTWGKNIAHHDEVTFANFLKYSYILYQVKCIYFTLFRYSGLVAASRTRLMLFISFLICSIASVLSSITEEASIWNICEYTDTSRTHFDFGDHYSLIMTICNYVILFLIPFVFISIIYSVIYTEAHANSERIRRDSNCTLLQGSTLVHHMFKCSVKITDRLGKLKFVQKLLSINIWLPSRFRIKCSFHFKLMKWWAKK